MLWQILGTRPFYQSCLQMKRIPSWEVTMVAGVFILALLTGFVLFGSSQNPTIRLVRKWLSAYLVFITINNPGQWQPLLDQISWFYGGDGHVASFALSQRTSRHESDISRAGIGQHDLFGCLVQELLSKWTHIVRCRLGSRQRRP